MFPNHIPRNKRTISQSEETESEVGSDEDSSDSIYSLRSDKVEIDKIDYCKIADKLKKKIINLINLRDHLVLKCARVDPIRGRDIEDTLENVLVPQYRLYFKQTKNKS